MGGHQEITAWQPAVRGICEVLHAHFTQHSYPMHTHDSWTLLIVDSGVIRYNLDRQEHCAIRQVVTLLPPFVPHNGTAATPDGFGKRVLYLDTTEVGVGLSGAAADQPVVDDPLLRDRIHQLHTTLARPGEELESECRLAFITERLVQHLTHKPGEIPRVGDATVAGRLRELLDERYVEGIELREAAAILHAHSTHLIRAFSRKYGLGPHQYLTSRRVDMARKLLLNGQPPRSVAAAVGFYDQSHLTRHFKRILGTSPARFARSGRRWATDSSLALKS